MAEAKVIQEQSYILHQRVAEHQKVVQTVVQTELSMKFSAKQPMCVPSSSYNDIWWVQR